MLDVLKRKINQRVDAWNREIDARSTSSTQIDIASVFKEILSDNLIHIAFGENLLCYEVTVDVILDKDARTTEKRSLNIRDALV